MTEEKARAGRPRDDDVDLRVTAVVWDLLKEQSVNTLSISQIAEAADTSRPAIYRRWNNVEEIVIDALLEATESDVPTPATPDPVLALQEYIVALAVFLNGRVGSLICELLGKAQNNPELRSRFHSEFLVIRRNHGRSLIERGQAHGVFRKDLDMDFIIDLYAGPLYYRAFSRHAVIDMEYAKSLADSVLKMIKVA